MKHGLVPVFVAVLVVGVAGGAFAARDIDELLDIASSNEGSPQGAEYMPKLRVSFATLGGSGIEGCVNSHGGWTASRTEYRVLVRLDEGGSVGLVEIDPEGPPTSCLKAVVAGLTLPSPPFAPFHAVLWAKRPESPSEPDRSD